jgi:hypothetical protein
MPIGAGGIAYVRDEVTHYQPMWDLIRDALEGEPAIKGEYGCRASAYTGSNRRSGGQARRYLPQPNPTDTTKVNQERYRQYVERAVYYNFSRRTRDGMVGQVFLRPPVVKKPKALDCLDNNADGQGLSLVQVAKRATQNALSYGRGGLLTDYPETTGPMTPDAMKEGNIQPTIITYYPWQITNWATRMIGGFSALSLVVLEETVIEESNDEYALSTMTQYRALRLDPTNEYIVEKHAPVAGSSATSRNAKPSYAKVVTKPTDADGKPFKEIPFVFTGSEANDIIPDQPPMYDLCSLNIAHYRNSADYEESCFQCGQATPVITGVNKYWVDNVLKGAIQLGSRGSISLPEGATADLLQTKPNSQPFEAMKHKEEQALALGAKLVQASTKQRTAMEAMIDSTSETSVLHNVANNVSAAIEQCLRWAAKFLGIIVPEGNVEADDTSSDSNVIQYKLNTEYELTRMNANDRLAVIKIWQSGAICYNEMRAVLKVDGTATMDDDEALAIIQEEQAQAAILGGATIADPLQAAAATSPLNTPPPGPGAGVKTPAKKTAAKKVAAKKTPAKRAA